jgi:hypothetical protein
MAIIDNRVTEEGDVLIIKPEIAIVGLISLYQFVDTTANESETDYFKKEFRYSTDGGLNFVSWTELTLLNIQGVNISKFNQFVIEYRYTRVGDAPEVDLEFQDILVSGEIEDLIYPVFSKTPFKDFFEINNIKVFGWALNVLEKLYRKGLILPDYIQRADNNSNLEDEDFIVYWNSITHFFALIVYFARQFENFETNEILLQEFLKSKDLAFSDNNDLEDLLYLYSHYVDEYKKRGTVQIISKKIDLGIDGELLRLINFVKEEFIFCLFQNYESGWCIGKSSPLWKNTENILNIIKGYEFTKDVVDITKYPLVNDDYIALNSGYLLIDDVPIDTECGVDYNSSEFKITTDPNEDYEISFRVKQESLLEVLNFGLRAYDIEGNALTLKNFNDNSDTNHFFQSISLKKAGTEYWVRAVLWNINKTSDFVSKTNLGAGDCMRSISEIASIVPIITVSSSEGVATKTYIRDIKIKPLKVNFSRGQLGIHNLLYLLFKNMNGELNINEIKEHISSKLISYNSFLKVKQL